MSGPIVTVSQGQLQGKTVQTASGKEYHSFQGIPYAKPPIGSLRFKAPEPSEPWEGIREATAEGNVCGQVDITTKQLPEFEGEEDCLFINVYTPSLDGEKKAVMVWIHGGGFKWGSGNSNIYGPDYLIEKDVIVVTLNYRLNVLGFLCLNTPDAPGNAGLKDQALALKWIKENISNFGGDEGNVTVFGGSAGGASVSYLAVSPTTKGLINKAALQSGTFFNSWSYLSSDPVENAKEIAKVLGHTGDAIDDLFAFLQNVPVKELVEETHKISMGIIKFGPVIEKEFPGTNSFLTEHPSAILASSSFTKIPVLIGNNSLESGWFLTALNKGEIDKDIRNYIPKDLNIDLSSKAAVKVADEIKSFYFGDGEVGMENLKKYLALIGDIHFSNDIRKFIDSVVEIAEEPVFEYRFSYFGALNTFKELLDAFGLRGASHGDECAYQFAAATHKDIDVKSQDVLTKDRVVELWTNFAKFGNPTPDDSHFVSIKWLPSTKEDKNFLDINTELTLSTNQNAKRVAFWRSIYAKFSQLPSTVTKDTDKVSVTPVVIGEKLPHAQEPEVQSAPEALQEPVVQDFPKLQQEPKVQDGPILQQEPVLEQGLEIHQEPKVQQEPEVQDVPKVHQQSEVQDVPKLQQEPVVEQGLEVHQEPKLEQEPEVQDVPKVHLQSEVQDLPKLQQEAEIQDVVNAEESEVQESQVQDELKLNELVKEIDDSVNVSSNPAVEDEETIVKEETVVIGETGPAKPQNGFPEQNGMNVTNGGIQTNGNVPKADVIRANDPQEDDLPKNIGVNKFVNFFESLGGKKVQ